ncbi:GatB/YqeY domain-containing protein [Convivina intestini]|uniref:GatB/YqeY domain-containing protein n=1 Tax=Convivina intestini TaxID=1505726 RepID=A0A2U1DFF8_9LACO|nr:GatB/YqeY domain-containing protein [Convivina intestini]PVY86425.1 hypothetical protein C7384_101343 [Convivina intestini]CAH1850362.1 putative protein YqeY [Convivina intestini]SDB83568.1 hypothetical protein SAMN05216341_101335 [Leuconostocaceae bacterium R-53105]
MSLLNQLQNDMKVAMKAQEKDLLSVIRQLKSAVMNEKIQLKKDDLNRDEELAVIAREVKQRKDSLQEFIDGQRQDLADKTQKELDLLSRYMPKQLDDNEITEIVQAAIKQSGATGPSDMGKVMGIVSGQVKGRADGKVVADRVKTLLAELAK